MKTSIISLSLKAAAILLAALCAPAAQAKMSKALNDTASTGMNALDYVLQRPLGNQTFGTKHFGDHLFMSGGAGISAYGGAPTSGFRPGARGEFSIGDWVTPVHGWRVNLSAGAHSKKAGQPWKLFGSLSADYLMNFSALLRGYNPSRRVEVIGILGAEYQRVRCNGAWGNELGLRAAIQTRFNVQSNLYLYIEPRLALLAGTRFVGDGLRRFRPDFSFNLGMGYRLLSKAERMAASTPFLTDIDGHLFFGAGGGIWAFARKAASQYRHPYGFGSFFVGKYFTPTAGLRVKAEFGRIGKVPATGANRYLAMGGLDFVWNLNSAFGGYQPDQVFDMSFNFGPAIAYTNQAEAKFYPGAEASLTALFRVSPNWGIYIEPEAKIFTRKFNRQLNSGGYGPFLSVMAGLRYTFGNFKDDHADSYKEFLNANNHSLTFAVAPAKRWRGNYGKGFMAQAGFGGRFTPISSWRVTAEGELFSRSPNYVNLALGADYMFSISTSMAGFNPNRVFDLSGVIGVNGGVAHYKGGLNGLFGGHIGLHGAFRLSDALDLFIEPQLVGNTLLGKSSVGWTPEARVLVGLKYKLGAPTNPGSEGNTVPADTRNFVSIAGGPSFFSGTFFSAPRRVSGSLDASLGRWFTEVSGGRIGVAYDIISSARKNNRPHLTTLHADYMLNVTSLMDHNPGRRFHIIGILGAGIGFSDAKNAKSGLMLETGGQFRYNLPANIDIHIEPNVSFWANRVAPGYQTRAHFVCLGRVMAGLSYRF